MGESRGDQEQIIILTGLGDIFLGGEKFRVQGKETIKKKVRCMGEPTRRPAIRCAGKKKGVWKRISLGRSGRGRRTG